jgi:tetratricopeptide (TPR) repeat protein
LWDLDSGRVVMILEGESEGATSAVWARDGRQLVTVHGQRLRFWDPARPDRRPGSEKSDLLAWHQKELEAAEGRYDWTAAEYHAGVLVGLDPGVASHHARRGVARAATALADHGRWKPAINDLMESFRLDPNDSLSSMYAGLLLLASGERSRYDELREKLLERFANTDNPAVANNVAWTCSLAPCASEPNRIVKLAKRAIERAPRDVAYADTHFLALIRAGLYDEALRARASMQKQPGAAGALIELYHSYYLSILHSARGERTEAERLFQNTNWIDEHLVIDQPTAGSPSVLLWSQLLELRLFSDEARARLKATTDNANPRARPERHNAEPGAAVGSPASP